MNLCESCAANIEGECCIRQFRIKKGRSHCYDYENIHMFFGSGKYEPLQDCTDF